VGADSILIRRPRIVDPGRSLDELGDILIEAGKITATGQLPADQIPEGCSVIEGSGLVACPGFIDVHCHLREPGFEYKETIDSGTRAAARGGFTTVCCMPNTEPPIDNAAVVELVQKLSRLYAVVRVLPIGCVTKGRQGKELAEMEELASAGVVAFSDDGDPVYDPGVMRLALSYSEDLGLPVIDHCQDPDLSRHGVMAESWTSTMLGLPGIPAAAEEAMVARDISLVELAGGRLHLAHLSTAGSASIVRQAKARGLPVTAEVCPHHLTMTDDWVMGSQGMAIDAASLSAYDTSTKVYPPLRSRGDVDALITGLSDGVIDCIATDHAPHDSTSKEVTYQDAAFGISVLETALGSALQLVRLGRITLNGLIERLTVGPSRVLGPNFHRLGTLAPGTPADIVLLDLDREWAVNAEEFESKGKNTPLIGATLKGKVVTTLVDGKVVFRDSGTTNG
jgi:dihydroorotase